MSKSKSKAPSTSQKQKEIKGKRKIQDQISAKGSKMGSRISRASIRVTKAIKSKQSKSVFSQREEEPNPDSLNCAHYERLMRIHAMLAMISTSQEQQIQYCLDAKFFLLKIFKIRLSIFKAFFFFN